MKVSKNTNTTATSGGKLFANPKNFSVNLFVFFLCSICFVLRPKIDDGFGWLCCKSVILVSQPVNLSVSLSDISAVTPSISFPSLNLGLPRGLKSGSNDLIPVFLLWIQWLWKETGQASKGSHQKMKYWLPFKYWLKFKILNSDHRNSTIFFFYLKVLNY